MANTMKKMMVLFCTMLALLSSSASSKTLVVYYSYTNYCREIVTTLTSQIEADVLEIQPAEKGLKYYANCYALGTQLLNAIKANPNDAGSYPAIDPVNTSLSEYETIIIVTPLWWGQMAAIMQTYLFNYGGQMAGKNIGLVVSSASSGISGVVADCKSLVPDGNYFSESLWINHSNHSNRTSLIQNWLKAQNFADNNTEYKMYVTIDGQTQKATLVDNAATRALIENLQKAPANVTLNSSGGFEIWGPLGFSLPTDNQQMTAQPGDVILYKGSNICLFYGSNSWSYTRLGKIDGLSESELRTFLKAGKSNIHVTLSLSSTTMGDVNNDGSLSVTDAMQVVDHILGYTMPAFHAEYADMNSDGMVDVMDVMLIVNVILGARDIKCFYIKNGSLDGKKLLNNARSLDGLEKGAYTINGEKRIVE